MNVNMTKPYTLGILAGMGPHSTAPFLENVLDACERLYGAKDDLDYPHMVVYSLPTPFFPGKALDDGEMVSALRQGIESLNAAGVDLIAVPCNTAHRYFAEMRKASTAPLLNIIAETVGRLGAEPKLTAVLGTSQTIQNQLYQKALSDQGKPVFWNPDLQEQVDQLINSVKGVHVSEQNLQRWQRIEAMLIANGVDEVIVACTDLFFCAKQACEGLKIYDSAAILAESLVQAYLKNTQGINYSCPKALGEMTPEELGQLFPIVLQAHDPLWLEQYETEKAVIENAIGKGKAARISHIGSTAIPGLLAKPTVDILVELQEDVNDQEALVAAMVEAGYGYSPQPRNPPPHMMFMKGYTPRGFEGQVYHVHVRYCGDWDEPYFRDYLIAHPEAAAAYGRLKTELAKQYRQDREGYTAAKTDFIRWITKLAKAERRS